MSRREGKIGKEIGMTRRRRMSGMKVLRRILLWILSGVKMRMVEAAEEEISARQEMVYTASAWEKWQDGRG